MRIYQLKHLTAKSYSFPRAGQLDPALLRAFLANSAGQAQLPPKESPKVPPPSSSSDTSKFLCVFVLSEAGPKLPQGQGFLKKNLAPPNPRPETSPRASFFPKNLPLGQFGASLLFHFQNTFEAHCYVFLLLFSTSFSSSSSFLYRRFIL